MSLFRTRPDMRFVAALLGGSVITLSLVAYGVVRWLRSPLFEDEDDDEITDFSDPYIPAQARAGSRRAVHSTV